LKIEVIYKNSKGEVINKKDLPKEARLSSPRIKTLVKDQYGYEYKSKRSKNSEVKVSYREPLKKETPLSYNEDEHFIKIVNDKYSISFNKKSGKAEVNSVIPPSMFKGFVEGRSVHLKTLILALEDVQAIKEDEELINLLIEA
jgi:hypothetical protein